MLSYVALHHVGEGLVEGCATQGKDETMQCEKSDPTESAYMANANVSLDTRNRGRRAGEAGEDTCRLQLIKTSTKKEEDGKEA